MIHKSIYLTLFVATFNLSAGVINVPSFVKSVSGKLDISSEAVYAVALKHSSRVIDGQTVAWPWTVYRADGKKIFLRNRQALIKYLISRPDAGFGVFNLKRDDMRLYGYDSIEEAIDPYNQTRVVGTVLGTKTDMSSAIALAEHYGLIESNPQRAVVTLRGRKLNKSSLLPIIKNASKKYGVPVDVIGAMITVESAYKVDALSHKGASGLMQIMPDTARDLGVNPKHLTNPEINIDTGTRYMAMQLREFGSLELALSAYNAGPNAVKKYNYTVPPYKETQNYVKKITKILSSDNFSYVQVGGVNNG